MTPAGPTDEFRSHSGVLQGDTLVPYIFVTMLDYAIDGRGEVFGFQLTRQQSRHKGTVVIKDLDLADDIALLSELIKQAQELQN